MKPSESMSDYVDKFDGWWENDLVRQRLWLPSRGLTLSAPTFLGELSDASIWPNPKIPNLEPKLMISLSKF